MGPHTRNKSQFEFPDSFHPATLMLRAVIEMRATSLYSHELCCCYHLVPAFAGPPERDRVSAASVVSESERKSLHREINVSLG